jgi:hypothetical protein
MPWPAGVSFENDCPAVVQFSIRCVDEEAAPKLGHGSTDTSNPKLVLGVRCNDGSRVIV